MSLVFISCQKDDGHDPSIPDTVSQSETMVSTTIAGVVTDENGTPVSGVTVSINNVTTVSDADGFYAVEDLVVPKDRCKIKFAHPNYLDSFVSQIPSKDGVTYVNTILINSIESASFFSTGGLSYTFQNGTQLDLPANGLVNNSGMIYSGQVQVNCTYLGPSTDDYSQKIPGSDLMAIDLQGESNILDSYGMVNIHFTGSANEKLQLAPGISADLKIPVDPMMLANAPATIPMWHFDETDGLWKEEGQAILNGNKYETSVTHFSWWNCDEPFPPGCLTGKVIDLDGNPLANFPVIINNYYSTLTDDKGRYSYLVVANRPFDVYAEKEFILTGNTVQSIPVHVPGISPNQKYVAPDLVILSGTQITLVSGNVTDCNGVPVPAYVRISWNGYNSTLIVNGSDFNFIVPLNTDITLLPSKYTTVGTPLNINSGNSTAPIHVGSLSLCDPGGTYSGTSFVISGGGYVNHLVEVDTTYTNAVVISNGPWVSIVGTDKLSGADITLNISLSDTIPGTYNMNDAAVLITIDSISFSTNLFMNGPGVSLNSWSPRATGGFAGTLTGGNGGQVNITSLTFNASSQ
jgi:protocatechuate 3,4-dioxygenase beta subunit